MRGCGFFRVIDGRIAFQRGYWHKLSFMKIHGLTPSRNSTRMLPSASETSQTAFGIEVLVARSPP
jgi:hypothetical protein